MDNALLYGTGANILTLALVSILWVCKQRLQSCNSACHTGIFSCTSKEVREHKENSHIDLIVQAIERDRQNTQRNANIV